MNVLRVKILNYRERFKRLDRKWHVLIGAQLFFALGAFRYNRQQTRLEQQQQQQQQSQNQLDSAIDSSSAKS
jgi:hypothetical protein